MDIVNRLSYLFGDEEHVGYRRQLVILREGISNLPIYKDDVRIVCSGSLGEGVHYPRSDDDLMFYSVRQSMLVRTSYEDVMLHGGLLMIPSEYSPGFCYLQRPGNNTGIPRTVQIHGTHFLSSVQFRDARLLPEHHPHGPCASFKIDEVFEYDFAHCLYCFQWPHIADKWVSRARPSGWPPRRLIDQIVNTGCHVVAIGNPDSPLCDIEWRVSFSVAERTLIHYFNHIQFLIYNLLKLVLKRVIDVRVPDVLCSYFMKTVMFYAIENTAPNLWIPEQINECYIKGLLLLYHFIDRMNCPNFFIPDNNMMRRKVKAHNRPLLLSVISEIMSHGITGALHICGECDVADQHISQREIELKADSDFLNGYLWTILDSHIKIQYSNNYICNIWEFLLSLRELFMLFQKRHAQSRCQMIPDITKVILMKMCSIAGQNSWQMLKSCSNNREKLRVLNIGRSLLRTGCGSDVSSGRLHFATYLYTTERFHHCLHIINDLLTKWSPYIMNQFTDNLRAKEMYMSHVCGNDYSLKYKMKIAWALDVIVCVKYTQFHPVPIRILLILIDKHIPFHPLIYSFFLQGLCFYNMGNTDCFRNSISSLEGFLKDLETESDKWHEFFGRISLGYMKMLRHDYHSALRCFTSAYLMDLSILYRSILSSAKSVSLTFIACVLNRTFQ